MAVKKTANCRRVIGSFASSVWDSHPVLRLTALFRLRHGCRRGIAAGALLCDWNLQRTVVRGYPPTNRDRHPHGFGSHFHANSQFDAVGQSDPVASRIDTTPGDSALDQEAGGSALLLARLVPVGSFCADL
jgi:hypothetical protein